MGGLAAANDATTSEGLSEGRRPDCSCDLRLAGEGARRQAAIEKAKGDGTAAQRKTNTRSRIRGDGTAILTLLYMEI
jgi:hypothetical protein